MIKVPVFAACRPVYLVDLDEISEVSDVGGQAGFGFISFKDGTALSLGRANEAAHVRASMRLDTPHNRRGTMVGS